MQCVKELRKRGKRLAILSNSSKRAHFARERLIEWDFGALPLQRIVTSGEVAWSFFDRDDPFVSKFGNACTLLGWRGHDDFTSKLGDRVNLVPLEEASFLLTMGVAYAYDGKEKLLFDTVEDAWPLLRRAKDQGLPMLCCNPDKVK